MSLDDSSQYYDAEEYFEALSDCTEDYVDVQEDAMSETSILDDDYLHRLAFYGDIEQLEEELRKCRSEDKARLDAQGNTILHLGVLRGNKDVLRVALESKVPSDTRNIRGWTALDEAIAAKNRDCVSLLYLHTVQEMKAEMKSAKIQLVQTLQEMPDYSMELSWQLGSPVIGYLLRKFAPHDTYKIYKSGSKIRVDGTLMGITKNTSSVFPEWKRGDFSLLFDGSTTPALIYLVFHDTKEYLDLTEEKLERKRNGQLDFDADLIMANGAGKTKLRATDFRFKPVKGWLTKHQTEKIESWTTHVYEASGKMTAVRRLKSPLNIPTNCTYEEYLQMQIIEDRVVEIPVNPPGLKGSTNGEEQEASSFETAPEKKVKPKKLTGRCWMAEDFPMSLRQLLPLLDVVGHANKHLGRVSKFMRKYGDMNMFPVRIQVPLLLTVYLMVSFKKFKLTKSPQGWCDLPESYKRVKLGGVMSSSLAALQGKKSPDSSGSSDESFSRFAEHPIDY